MKQLVAFFSLIFCASFLTAQTWSLIPDAPSGPFPHSLSPKDTTDLTLKNDTLWRYSTNTGQFTPVAGFNSSTDLINGLLQKGDTVFTYGRKRVGSIRYGSGFMLPPYTDIVAYTPLQFTGASAPSATVQAMGIDQYGNIMVYGTNLAVINGVSLVAAQVGYIEVNGAVTALQELKPVAPSGETGYIKFFGWDSANQLWKVGGNFIKLGTQDCYDLGAWNGTTMMPINTTSATNVACISYANGFIAWTGTTTDGGVTSPCGFYLNNLTIQALGSGFSGLKPVFVLTVGSNVWYVGKTGIATWNTNTSFWTNQTGNLLQAGDTTSIVMSVARIKNDTMVVTGNFTQNFPYIARSVISNPLPVELISFTARLWINGSVKLEWVTATEQNNRGWSVERSPDGTKNWLSIGFAFGAGNSTEQKKYDWIDKEPSQGTVYYRLHQEDHDGAFSFSDIVSVLLPGDEPTIYPNPTHNQITIQFPKEQKDVSLKIFSVAGDLVLMNQNTDVLWFNLSINLPNGIYTAEIIADGKTYVKKLTIAK